jgi:hypothetical protein
VSEPGDGARLVACRACGNRVALAARRCPACGVREPAGAPPSEPTTSPAPPSHRWRLIAALVGAALAGAGASAAVFMLKSPAPPPATERGLEPSAATPRPSPPPAEVLTPPAAPAVPPPVSEPSRSRGRADWLFFFKPGDQLVRMGDDAAMGMVIRTVPRHAFADGTAGPAYVLQLPDGAGQRVVDADELERGGRLR